MKFHINVELAVEISSYRPTESSLEQHNLNEAVPENTSFEPTNTGE